MKVKIMIVPGSIVEVEVPEGATVMNVAEAAKAAKPGIDWIGLTKDRVVRVNKKLFSNVEEIDQAKGYFGSIITTTLNHGDVVLVITKIKGNDAADGVLTCLVNGEEYALESPDTIANVLKNIVGINPDEVASVTVDGEEADLQDLVGDDDFIEVEMIADEEVEDEEENDNDSEIIVDGESFSSDEAGKLSAIRAILEL